MSNGEADLEHGSPLVRALWSRVRRECRRRARQAGQLAPQEPRGARAGLLAAFEAEPEPGPERLQALLEAVLDAAAAELGYSALGAPRLVLIGPGVDRGVERQLAATIAGALAARRGPELWVLADREAGAATLLSLGLSEDLAVFESEELSGAWGGDSAERPIAPVEWVRFEAGELELASGLGPAPTAATPAAWERPRPATPEVDGEPGPAAAPAAAVPLDPAPGRGAGRAGAEAQVEGVRRPAAGRGIPGAAAPQRAGGPEVEAGAAPAGDGTARERQRGLGPEVFRPEVLGRGVGPGTAQDLRAETTGSPPGGGRAAAPGQPPAAPAGARGAARPSGPQPAGASTGAALDAAYGGYAPLGAELAEARGRRFLSHGPRGEAELLCFAPFARGSAQRAKWRAAAARLEALEAPGLAPVWAQGIDAEGRAFLVRPRAAGPDLRQRLAQRGVLGAAELLRLARSLALSLAEAHAAGLCHGDLRLDWVEELEPGRAWRLYELGLAPLFGAGRTALDRTPAGRDLTRPQPWRPPHGAPGFAPEPVPETAAPELAAQLLTGAWPADPQAADRFALGLLLFEAAAGRPALPPAGSPVELLEQRALGRGPRARDLAHLPAYLSAAIDRLLEPRPDRRAADLSAWLAQLDRERRAAGRRRALRLGAGLAVLGLLGATAALSPSWVQARAPSAPQAVELSPDRPSAALPWPAGRSLPAAGAVLELVDPSGAPLPGWRVERDALGRPIAMAPRRTGGQPQRLDARLSIDGRLRAEPAFELVFDPRLPLVLGEPRLLDPLGAARPAGAVFADELDSLRLVLPLEGAEDPPAEVYLAAGEQRFELGPSLLERGLLLSRLREALGLPSGGAWSFEVVAQREGAELRRAVALEVLPRPDGARAGATPEAAQDAPAAPAGVGPETPGLAAAGEVPDGGSAGAPGSGGLTQGAPAAAADAPADPVAIAADPGLPAATQPPPDSGAAADGAAAAAAAAVPWKLALDGLEPGQVLGPDSKPKLLLSLAVEGPTLPPLARIELRRAELATPLLEGQLTPEAFRSEGAGWRTELTLPSPWRPADGSAGVGDGSFALVLQAFESSAAEAPAARLVRPFDVALRGPRLAWEKPPGGVLRPGPQREFLLGIYAHDDNGVAEVSGTLWLENGQRRELRFEGPSSAGSAAVVFEPGDSLLEARLELRAQDRFGNSSQVLIEPLRVGLVAGFSPERVPTVPQPEALGEGFTKQPRPCPPMRRIAAPAQPYRFGGRSDELENLCFAEAGLQPFQSEPERALPRAWDLPLPDGRPLEFLLDEREVEAREFLVFLRAEDGWPAARWWPLGAPPGSAERRAALESELAALEPQAPAVGMTWDEAAAFAAWCGKRLPTWIELEYAQRAGLEYRPLQPDGPEQPWRGLSSGVAEWTATPVWFELPPAERPASHRAALAAHLAAALDPAWALERPGVREFWASGGAGGGSAVDFSAALRLERGRGDPRVGLRCALDLPSFRQRAAARLAALSAEAGP